MEVEEEEDDGLAGENVGNEVQLEIEELSLLSHNQPTYLRFRLGRRPQPTSKCSRFVLFVFKVTFCSLGLWGHQAWNYIPRVLLSAICVYQTAFVLSFDIGCPNFDCTSRDEGLNRTQSNGTKVDKDSFYEYNQNGLSILFLLAAPVSYLVMIGCFIISKSKDSAMVSPSSSMVGDIQRRHVFLLLITMSFSGVFCWMFATVFTPKALCDGNIYSLSLALLWASLSTCSIFAVSSFTLGTFARDTCGLIQDVQNGTLDDVIRIHEDLCTVVFNTVSAYSVWFVVHWFTYGVCAVVILMSMPEFMTLFAWSKFPISFKVTCSFLLFCLLYMFILPCVCAAGITSSCAGIYEKINCSTSDDWSEGHPFKDRHNIALFVSYAKERRCGFKVGRITFNTSLAWFSFFFGLAGLLYHFF